MKIANFGHFVAGDGVERVNFFSDRAIWDFDAAFYDLEGVLRQWFQKDVWERADHGVLTNGSADQLIQAFVKRSTEMREFMDHGHPVLFVPSVTPQLAYEDGHGDWSQLRDLGEFFPVCGKHAEAANGQRVEVKGPPAIVSFAKKLEAYWWYGATVKNAPGIPCFFTPKANHVLGSFVNKDNKWMLVCPRLVGDSSKADAALLEAFYELRGATAGAQTLNPLPDWGAIYSLPGEIDLKGQISKEEERLEQVAVELAQLREQQDRLLDLKRLFTDKGDGLVTAVTYALQGIGFKVEPGPEGRDDLIATFDKYVAVIEVKGKDKRSAAEADAAQLEKWVIRHFESQGVMPKGILIANAFREVPLLKRVEEPFPDQMVPYAKGRSHCLITGLQLLCLYFETKTKGNAAQCVKDVFETNGRFARYSGVDWQKTVEVLKGK